MDVSFLSSVTVEVAHAPSPALVAGHVGPVVTHASAAPSPALVAGHVGPACAVPGGNPAPPAAKARAPGTKAVVRSWRRRRRYEYQVVIDTEVYQKGNLYYKKHSIHFTKNFDKKTQNGLWQEVIKAKYLRRDDVASVKSKFADSPIWKAIMKVKPYYMAGREVVLNSGNIARHWFDSIRGSPPLKDTYAMLFNICNHQNITVGRFKTGVDDDFFRRQMHHSLSCQRGDLKKIVEGWTTSDVPDQIVWTLRSRKNFSTKYVYEYLERSIAGCDYRWIWRAKIPLKILIFLSQIFQDAILTRDVMKRKKWGDNPNCSFCKERETSQHLCFTCRVARVVWRTIGLNNI
ncbi:hypothetical protein D1007_58383 [Hordeum vulgare]|nr:hypothetical protein D1007_58383 [Hordeum vulgare]